jgi:hypothetical protein
MTMRKLEFESDLAKRVFAKWYYDGLAEGEAKGKAEGMAEALLTVLRARGLAVSPRREASNRACRDAQVLDAWLTRAVTAGRVGEVFGRR